MRLIAKIKEIIYKVKDYDRLEDDYCTVLDMVTGARLSKPNYTMDAVRDTKRECIAALERVMAQYETSKANINTIVSAFRKEIKED